MTKEEMKEKAMEKVKTDNPQCTDVGVDKLYENILDGVLVSVSFKNTAGNKDYNHVHFGRNEERIFRWSSDVLNAIANAKERIWFFRFLELAGVGGVIAFVLVLIFSVLLCVLALRGSDDKTSILEVVKLAFTVILGYFFGSQSAAKK